MTKYPPNTWTYGSQNYRLYSELCRRGFMTSLEIVNTLHILSHTRRLKDLRDWLETQGWTIYTIKVSDDPKIFKYLVAENLPLLNFNEGGM